MRTRWFRFAVMSFSAAFFASLPSANAVDFANCSIDQRIDKAGTMASCLQIDGKSDDWNLGNWGAFPEIKEALGDCADPSRDLVSSRVVASPAGLYVCVSTAGTPSREHGAFGFRLDFAGITTPDLEFGATGNGRCPSVTRYPRRGVPGQPTKHPIQGIQVGIDKCVEWFVPWESLAQALPAGDRDEVVGPNTRSLVRITTYSWDIKTKRITDNGAAAACLRLPRRGSDIDEPLPNSVTDTAEMPLMMDKQVYVNVGSRQGAEGTSPGHKSTWCYDMTVVDTTLAPGRIPGSPDNSQYFAWGMDLVAPFAGKLIGATNDAEDHAAHSPVTLQTRSNVAYLQADGKTLWFVHNRTIARDLSRRKSETRFKLGIKSRKSGIPARVATPMSTFKCTGGTSAPTSFPSSLRTSG
jgi:hypothetical protein